MNEFVKKLFTSGKLSSLSFGEALATNIGFGYNLHVVPPDTAGKFKLLFNKSLTYDLYQVKFNFFFNIICKLLFLIFY